MSGEASLGNNNIAPGVPIGGPDLFSNAFGPVYEIITSFCEGLGMVKKTNRIKWADGDGKDYYGMSNGWRGYNLEAEWVLPKVKAGEYEIPRVKGKKPKPKYPIADFMLKNAEDLGELAKKFGEKYNIREVKEIYPFYRKKVDEIYERLPNTDKEILKEHKNLFFENYMKYLS